MEGDDQITGGAGRDCLEGGPGKDLLSGRGGRDVVHRRPGLGPPCRRQRRRPPHRRADRLRVRVSAPALNRVSGGPGADVVDVANATPRHRALRPGRDRVSADREDRLIGCERKTLLSSPLPRRRRTAGGRTTTFLVRFRAIEEVATNGEYFSIEVDGPAGLRPDRDQLPRRPLPARRGGPLPAASRSRATARARSAGAAATTGASSASSRSSTGGLRPGRPAAAGCTLGVPRRQLLVPRALTSRAVSDARAEHVPQRRLELAGTGTRSRCPPAAAAGRAAPRAPRSRTRRARPHRERRAPAAPPAGAARARACARTRPA